MHSAHFSPSENRKNLALIVAMTPEGVIGKNGTLPWRLPEDLAHFKRQTLGHAIIMGRKTFESIGRPLPGRRNIVVTRSPSAQFPGCEVAKGLAEAVALARTTDDEPFVIGGAAIYAEALPWVTRLVITDVLQSTDGDTYFPSFDRNAFREVQRTPGEGVIFRELVRV